MVATVILGQHLAWVTWVAERSFKVDDGIKGAALVDPRVHGLTLRFPLGRIEAGVEGLVLEREQGATEDLQTARVGAQGELVQAGDHLVGGDDLLGELVAIDDFNIGAVIETIASRAMPPLRAISIS